MNTGTEEVHKSLANRKCTLCVCTSCRPAGFSREPIEVRPGFCLHDEISQALATSEIRESVNLEAVQCLSLCKRPCGIAMASRGAWTYLFGDQSPDLSVNSILECLSIYLQSTRGEMPRTVRPAGLRKSILGRIPPLVDERLESRNEQLRESASDDSYRISWVRENNVT